MVHSEDFAPAVRHVKTVATSLVVRHNNLLEAQMHITTQEKRLMMVLMSSVESNASDFNIYRLNVQELAQAVGLEDNKNIYRIVSEVVEKLLKRSVRIKDLDKKVYISGNLISASKYHFDKGYVDIEISQLLKPYLLQLKNNFTIVELKYSLALKTAYAMRMYDLMKQYLKIGTRTFTIQELRDIFGLFDTQYPLYGDFKKRVIEPAKFEINRSTDIEFNFEEVKDVRKVVGLVFTIQINKGEFSSVAVQALSDEQSDIALHTRLSRHGFKSKTIQAILARYAREEKERVTFALNEAEKLSKQGKIRNTAAWIKKAIEVDYRPQRNLFQEDAITEQKIAQDLAADKQKRIAALESLNRQRLELDKNYSAYLKEKAFAHLLSLPLGKIQELEQTILPKLTFGAAAFVKELDFKEKWGATLVFIELQKIFTSQNLVLGEPKDKWAKMQGLKNHQEIEAAVKAVSEAA